MANQQRAARLLAPTVPLVLKVDAGEPEEKKLELKLAWTMLGVIQLEARLRALGVNINVIGNASEFWKNLDGTRLAFTVWSMSQQEHPEYVDDDGFDVIASYLVPENYVTAMMALKECFVESLSKKQRDELRAAEADAERLATERNVAGVDKNPTPAPVAS